MATRTPLQLHVLVLSWSVTAAEILYAGNGMRTFIIQQYNSIIYSKHPLHCPRRQ
jgi:hypothetical protein